MSYLSVPNRGQSLPFGPQPVSAKHGGLLLALISCLSPSAVPAMVSSPDMLCTAAAQTASEQTGVPLAVLQAISIVESGRQTDDGTGVQPWPWAFNHAGEGFWFNTADEAMAEVSTLIDQGVRNIDLGCFQLNLHWHSKAFSGLDAMFDPTENALYAAKFLQRLYGETGDWSQAAGAYHSATPDLAQDYRVKFDATLAQLTNAPLPMASPAAPLPVQTQNNRFPLLLAGALGNRGSLVPLQHAARPLIGAPSW